MSHLRFVLVTVVIFYHQLNDIERFNRKMRKSLIFNKLGGLSKVYKEKNKKRVIECK